jgi:hypothetical protein
MLCSEIFGWYVNSCEGRIATDSNPQFFSQNDRLLTAVDGACCCPAMLFYLNCNGYFGLIELKRTKLGRDIVAVPGQIRQGLVKKRGARREIEGIHDLRGGLGQPFEGDAFAEAIEKFDAALESARKEFRTRSGSPDYYVLEWRLRPSYKLTRAQHEEVRRAALATDVNGENGSEPHHSAEARAKYKENRQNALRALHVPIDEGCGCGCGCG